MDIVQRVGLVIVSLIGFMGCNRNASPKNSPKTVPWPKDDAKGDGDSYYKKLDPGETGVQGNGKFNNRFWLRFDGGTITTTQSFIVERSGAEQVIPAFSAADIGSSSDLESVKQTVFSTVKTLFENIALEFSLEEPQKPYSTVFIGGKNFTGRQSVLGVAPLDVGNWSGEDILFAFSKEFSGRQSGEGVLQLAQTIAHEISHSVGARHIESNKALMSPTVATTNNQLDAGGPVVDGAGAIENTKTLLEVNVGKSAVINPPSGIPDIDDLDIISDGDVGQFSVLTLTNLQKNASFKLADFNYTWSFGTLNANGPLIRIRFRDKQPQTLTLVVSNEKNESKTFSFSVGKTGSQ